MLDTLIVIATHGDSGVDLLRESIPKWKRSTQPGTAITIVQTGGMSEAVMTLCLQHEVGYLRTPYKGYDTGAYLWAYWYHKAKNYLFVQDSTEPREDDFVEQFADAMPSDMGVVGWSCFTMECWDGDAQRNSTEFMYGKADNWPKRGIFGPIFYTTHETLAYMEERGLLPMPPVHKLQQQAMERAWAILFHRAGLDVNFLVYEEMPRGYAMARDEYPALRKVFRIRS